MSKPSINIPAEFAINGTKTDFSQAKITDGFDRLQPDVLPGNCLNKFIDDTYKGLNGVLELYKGAVLYDVTETYSNTSIVFYIDTNDNNKIKIYHSLQNSNTGNSLSDDTYWEEVQLGGGATRNIGEIVPSIIPLTDADKHLLDGSLILGGGIYQGFVDYIAELYTDDPTAKYFCTEAQWQTLVTTYGVCGKFVYDSVNNTVRLPKITGFVEGTTDASALGELIEAGLPNILATWNNGFFSGGGTGAVTTTAYSSNFEPYQGSSHPNLSKASFNASRSSAIYGNSDTVQPQAIKVLYYIVIATSTKTDIEVDIDEIATDLNGKADVDLSNTTPAISFATAMNNAGIRTVIETYQNGTSGYRIWSDGYCEQWVHKDNWGDVSSFTFLKAFKDTNYIVVFNGRKEDSTSNLGIKTITTTTINYNNADQSLNGDLLAKGYLASGQY